MIRALCLYTMLVFASLSAGACLSGGLSAESADEGGGGNEPPDPSRPDPGSQAQCQAVSDCELAASTCCQCPSFALPVGQNFDEGCEDVQCEPSGMCPAVEASCSAGQCVMICSPVITNQICAFGFERDAAGCLMNVCASSDSSAPPSCNEDSECTQIPADCCGCGRGGQDKAVPTSEADAEVESLDCPSDPACPEIDVCNADEGPRCIAGQCVLSEEPGSFSDEDTLCGTPELSVCAAGSQCVLNALSSKDAGTFGVGACEPQ